MRIFPPSNKGNVMPRKIEPKFCNCGCGEMTRGGNFIAGHDRKLGAAIERAAGGLLELKALVEDALGRPIDSEADPKGRTVGHYRKKTNDYSIPVGSGSLYIKPRESGLVITAHPNIESRVAQLFGAPTGRESPNSINYARWEITK